MYPKYVRIDGLRGQVIPTRWYMVIALCHLSKNDDTLELVHYHKFVFLNLVQGVYQVSLDM
jgi:hypothetical protein